MLRRIVRLPLYYGVVYSNHRCVTASEETRGWLAKNLSAVKEECKGQGLDLADMSDATKATSRSLQECISMSDVEDTSFKAKVEALSASIKVYNNRLNNLKNEVWSIQTEVDVLLKLLWGTANPQKASFAAPPPLGDTRTKQGGLPSNRERFNDEVEGPPLNKMEHDVSCDTVPLNKKSNVERVIGERVEDKLHKKPHLADNSKEKEIEVETIEVELAPDSDNSIDEMKITDITKELYERGVDFSDCLDAKSLRQRYKDVLSGKIGSPRSPSLSASDEANSYAEPFSTNTDQPSAPARPRYTEERSYNPPPPNKEEVGLAQDPYPNAMRKMVDAMKFVWQIKQELAAEKGIDPNSVDLWSGKVKLEDHKRLYDYPTAQNYPIEVRQKGDMPL